MTSPLTLSLVAEKGTHSGQNAARTLTAMLTVSAVPDVVRIDSEPDSAAAADVAVASAADVVQQQAVYDLMILMDMSGSMGLNNNSSRVLTALKSLLCPPSSSSSSDTSLLSDPTTRLTLVFYNATVIVALPPTLLTVSGRQAASAAFDEHYRPGGASDFGEAMTFAIRYHSATLRSAQAAPKKIPTPPEQPQQQHQQQYFPPIPGRILVIADGGGTLGITDSCLLLHSFTQSLSGSPPIVFNTLSILSDASAPPPPLPRSASMPLDPSPPSTPDAAQLSPPPPHPRRRGPISSPSIQLSRVMRRLASCTWGSLSSFVPPPLYTPSQPLGSYVTLSPSSDPNPEPCVAALLTAGLRPPSVDFFVVRTYGFPTSLPAGAITVTGAHFKASRGVSHPVKSPSLSITSTASSAAIDCVGGPTPLSVVAFGPLEGGGVSYLLLDVTLAPSTLAPELHVEVLYQSGRTRRLATKSATLSLPSFPPPSPSASIRSLSSSPAASPAASIRSVSSPLLSSLMPIRPLPPLPELSSTPPQQQLAAFQSRAAATSLSPATPRRSAALQQPPAAPAPAVILISAVAALEHAHELLSSGSCTPSSSSSSPLPPSRTVQHSNSAAIAHPAQNTDNIGCSAARQVLERAAASLRRLVQPPADSIEEGGVETSEGEHHAQLQRLLKEVTGRAEKMQSIEDFEREELREEEEKEKLRSAARGLSFDGENSFSAATTNKISGSRSNSSPLLPQKSSISSPEIVGGRYRLKRELGRGAYGVIYLAEDISITPAKEVAVKRVAGVSRDHVIGVQTLREIRLLKHLRKHKNVSCIADVVGDGDSPETLKTMCIVMDLMETDLQRVINSTQELTPRHHKWFLYQLLLGVHRMHSAGIMHRDLKPSNLLVDKKCNLQVADLGLARGVGAVAASPSSSSSLSSSSSTPPPTGDSPASAPNSSAHFTEYVVTRWYRAPELLLSDAGRYGPGVDIWSVGCIFAELLNRAPLFPGKDYVTQLSCILSATVGGGVINVVDYVTRPGGVAEFFDVAEQQIEREKETGGGSFLEAAIQNPKGGKGHGAVKSVGALEMDLLRRMLAFCPRSRISAKDALEHDYFKGVRKPGDIKEAGNVPIYEEWSADEKLESDAAVVTKALFELCNPKLWQE